MSRDCGGLGLCGKCRVLRPDLPVLEGDRRVLGPLCEAGWRLGCLHGIRAENQEAAMTTAGSGMQVKEGTPVYGALDIGTTTLVLALLDENGQLVQEHHWPNPQRQWGADVLSRILNWKDIPTDLVRDLVRPHLTGLRRLVVTGNTVMTHLWLGEDPSPLAQVPFTIPVPDPVRAIQADREEIVCAPFAPYVGADIRTRLQALLGGPHAHRFLYMDLGTNGELAWYDHGVLTVCSTACGPALEGAGISIGMPALPGAITRVVQTGDLWRPEVIGDGPAIGVCGSGLISWIDALRQQGLITPAGKLKDCPEIEGLQLSAKDVRMFQLAKGALQAGWQMLVPDPETVDEIWVAGGFSLGLDEVACIRLGLFHPAWRGKIRFYGNMALKGACRLAVHPEPDGLEARVLELEQDPAFSQRFARAMYLKPAD